MEIYNLLETPASKEFEKLLNSKLSKTKIEEGKIIQGKITKITDKFFPIVITRFLIKICVSLRTTDK